MLATAKIHILKQFTTCRLVETRCGGIVLATAKIHILKQFTTLLSSDWQLFLLCLLLQRYTFWSNSQPVKRNTQVPRHCACYCKDTHFEAIHNHHARHNFPWFIVLATAKIHILKQFTTVCVIEPTHYIIVLATAKIHILKQFTTSNVYNHLYGILCLLLQRYTFWSNSQPVHAWPACRPYCACYCKDTHFEAIHNRIQAVYIHHGIVLATAKIHILKQFTTVVLRIQRFPPLCLLLQRYTFWSNSQLVEVSAAVIVNCACYCKDTHFEAIHNSRHMNIHTDKNCACYCKDTHFEAIHNLRLRLRKATWIVLATAKIHILKQFTTYQRCAASSEELCLLLQRYTFWSNSQPCRRKIYRWLHCACYCKDTHFEAIHNNHSHYTFF